MTYSRTNFFRFGEIHQRKYYHGTFCIYSEFIVSYLGYTHINQDPISSVPETK